MNFWNIQEAHGGRGDYTAPLEKGRKKKKRKKPNK